MASVKQSGLSFVQLEREPTTTSVGQSHTEFFTKCATWCGGHKVDGILQGERSLALDCIHFQYGARTTCAGGQTEVVWWSKVKPVASTPAPQHRSLRAKPSVQKIRLQLRVPLMVHSLSIWLMP